MKYLIPLITVTLFTGCGGDADICRESYWSGPDTDLYESDCPTKTTSVDAASSSNEEELADVELTAEERYMLDNSCTSSWKQACTAGEECREIYESDCGDQNAIATTDDELGSIRQPLLRAGKCAVLPERGPNIFHNGFRGDILSTPIARDAKASFADMFLRYPGEPDLRLVRATSRAGEATRTISGYNEVESRDPEVPDSLGVTKCRIFTDSGLRFDCRITIFMPPIREIATANGHDAGTIARVTALHEFGHVVCLDHYIDRNPLSPTYFSALNRSFPNDTGDIFNFFQYTEREVNEVRSVTQ